MLRALIAVGLFATAICGVKGAPQPPAKISLTADAGSAPVAAELAPDATEIDPLHDPLALDGGCLDGGCR